MDRRTALKELKELESTDVDTTGSEVTASVGTPELQHRFGWYLDTWHGRDESFDPIEVVADADDSRYDGYSWSRILIFQNKNKRYSVHSGSGCSCNSIQDYGPEWFPDLDQVVTYLKGEMSKEFASEKYRKAYRQILTKIVTRRVK